MKKIIFSILVILLPLANIQAQEKQLSYTYNGYFQENGKPVNGTRAIIASIIDQNNNLLAKEENHAVSVTGGSYTMVINNIDAEKLNLAKQIFLSINIDGTDYKPTIPITNPAYSVPYAIRTQVADNVIDLECKSCISPHNISFVTNDNFNIPACETNYMLRAEENSLVCEKNITINEDNPEQILNQIEGDIGINTESGWGHNGINVYKQIKTIQQSEIDNSIQRCPCDNDPTIFDCQTGEFKTYEFADQNCYDEASYDDESLYHIFSLSETGTSSPMDKAIAIKNGIVGFGTAVPSAPIHVRSQSGQNHPEFQISANDPEINLVSPDRSQSYTIKVTSEGLTFINNKTNKKMVINDGYVKIDRTFNKNLNNQ